MATYSEDDDARKLIAQLAGTPTTLTTEEREECSAYLAANGLTGNNDGYWAVQQEIADDLRRKLISDRLQQRALRFYLIEKDVGRALSSAARACAFCPKPQNLYEFAAMLKRTGARARANIMFRYFLHKVESAPTGQFEELASRHWDLPTAISVARGEVEEPQ